MRTYHNLKVKRILTLKTIITLEYLTLTPTFSFPEEKHEFYEFTYVDSGKLLCYINNKPTLLKQGEIYLIPKNVSHYYKTETSSSIFIMCFDCTSDFLELIEGKNSTNKQLQNIFGDLLTEAKNAFNIPFYKTKDVLENPTFGSIQLTESKFEEILIKLIRQKLNDTNSNVKFVTSSEEFENVLTNDIIKLLKENIYSSITLDDICKKTYYSKAYVNVIFKKNIGSTIIQFYIGLKINEAKKLLKENHSAKQVSNTLCFDSPNYFAKTFKKHTGLTPKEYKKMINK